MDGDCISDVEPDFRPNMESDYERIVLRDKDRFVTDERSFDHFQ